jgi:hypothetical protein
VNPDELVELQNQHLRDTSHDGDCLCGHYWPCPIALLLDVYDYLDLSLGPCEDGCPCIRCIVEDALPKLAGEEAR